MIWSKSKHINPTPNYESVLLAKESIKNNIEEGRFVKGVGARRPHFKEESQLFPVPHWNVKSPSLSLSHFAQASTNDSKAYLDLNNNI